MTGQEPVEVTNLDRYGSAELPWSRARDLRHPLALRVAVNRAA